MLYPVAVRRAPPNPHRGGTPIKRRLLLCAALLPIALIFGAQICAVLLNAHVSHNALLPPNLGNWPRNVDAVHSAPGEPLKFAVIGDIQMFGTFENIIDGLDQEKVAFLILLGDVAYPSSTAYAHKLLQLEIAETAVSFPIFYVPGHHDVDPDSFPVEQWRRTYGPDQFAFVVGRDLFIILHCTSAEHHLDTAAADFLEKQLREKAQGKRIFVFNHIPLYTGIEPRGRSLDSEEKARIARLLEQYHVDYFMAGDYHTYGAFNRLGTRYIVSGGGGGSLDKPRHLAFHHAVLFSVTPDGVEERLIVAQYANPLEDQCERLLLLKLFPLLEAHQPVAIAADLVLLALAALIIRAIWRKRRKALPHAQAT